MEIVAFYKSFIYSSLLHIWIKSGINYQKKKKKTFLARLFTTLFINTCSVILVQHEFQHECRCSPRLRFGEAAGKCSRATAVQVFRFSPFLRSTCLKILVQDIHGSYCCIMQTLYVHSGYKAQYKNQPFTHNHINMWDKTKQYWALFLMAILLYKYALSNFVTDIRPQTVSNLDSSIPLDPQLKQTEFEPCRCSLLNESLLGILSTSLHQLVTSVSLFSPHPQVPSSLKHLNKLLSLLYLEYY